jgi:hypothetical protein
MVRWCRVTGLVSAELFDPGQQLERPGKLEVPTPGAGRRADQAALGRSRDVEEDLHSYMLRLGRRKRPRENA